MKKQGTYNGIGESHGLDLEGGIRHAFCAQFRRKFEISG